MDLLILNRIQDTGRSFWPVHIPQYHKDEYTSTVDYFVASSGLLEQATEMNVMNDGALHCNTYSDHYPIRLKLKADEVMQEEVRQGSACRDKSCEVGQCKQERVCCCFAG